MAARIVLADDQGLFRSTLRMLVDAEPDLEVVAEARNGAEAVRAVRRHTPDVAVLDISMPGIDGISAARAISADPLLKATRVMMLTTFERDDIVAAALRAGASGFLGKDAEPQSLLDAIRAIAAGQALLSPTATRLLIDEYLSRPSVGTSPAEEVLARLTPREREIVALVAEGMTNQDIAARLHISVLTTKTHVSRSMAKLEAHDRAQLVVRAYECGLCDPGVRRRQRP